MLESCSSLLCTWLARVPSVIAVSFVVVVHHGHCGPSVIATSFIFRASTALQMWQSRRHHGSQ